MSDDLSTRDVTPVGIIRVVPTGRDDPRRHGWTCPKAAPFLRTGDCTCIPDSKWKANNE